MQITRMILDHQPEHPFHAQMAVPIVFPVDSPDFRKVQVSGQFVQNAIHGHISRSRPVTSELTSAFDFDC
jgi:hypothetical protein